MPFPFCTLAVTLRNKFEKNIGEFEIATRELHLRGADVFVGNKQPIWFQRAFNLVENVFKLKNMMQRCVRIDNIIGLSGELDTV